MFPPPDLARSVPPPVAADDLDELWRGIAIILSWTIKHYGWRVAERLTAFLVKRYGAAVALPVVSVRESVTSEQR